MKLGLKDFNMKSKNKSLNESGLTFDSLVESIGRVHEYCAAQAGKAVNVNLTVRNWMIGHYIEEYEREGVDRARYGDRLMDTLSDSLVKKGLSRCDRRELYRYRQFYMIYPQIVESATPQFAAIAKGGLKRKKVESLTPQLTRSGKDLVKWLSFAHFAELIELDVFNNFYIS